MYEYQVYEPLTFFEFIFAFGFVIFCMAFLAGILRYQYILSLPPEDFEPVKPKVFTDINKGFYFDYSVENNIKLLLDGELKMVATFVDDKIHFFWSPSNQSALPPCDIPQHHFMSVERMMKKAVKGRQKRSGVISNPDQVEDWKTIKYPPIEPKTKIKRNISNHRLIINE